MKEADPFYSSGAWRAVREVALSRDLHQCQDCLREWLAGARDRVNDAELVHHIIPRKQRPDLALDLSNLTSLCAKHHEARHPERRYPRQASARPEGVRVIKI